MHEMKSLEYRKAWIFISLLSTWMLQFCSATGKFHLHFSRAVQIRLTSTFVDITSTVEVVSVHQESVVSFDESLASVLGLLLSSGNVSLNVLMTHSLLSL